jgi:putative SOS response-associated peptidase YedK
MISGAQGGSECLPSRKLDAGQADTRLPSMQEQEALASSGSSYSTALRRLQHWFAIDGGDPRPAFAFPGIGGATMDRKKDGPHVDLEVYAFLTTTPNELAATVNHERMPVLLTREEEFEIWLSGSPEEALALAQEYPPKAMRIVQEGF